MNRNCEHGNQESCMVLGEKVNKVCARKVGDPAKVYTHYLLPSDLIPINTTFSYPLQLLTNYKF